MRISIKVNKELLLKLKYIADFEFRTMNKEIEQLVKNHIRAFEAEHSKIVIETNNH